MVEFHLISYLVQNPDRYRSCRPYLKNFEPQNTILRYCWKILSTRFEQLEQFPTQVETEWLLVALAPPGAGTEFLTTIRETVVPALFSQTWTDVTGDMLEKLLFDLERDRMEGQVKQVRSLADLKKLQSSFTQLEDALTYNARTYIKPFADNYIMNPLSIIREFWGDPIPLGMGEWDTTWLQGGVRIGELLTLIASTNGGKSLCLFWWAISMAMRGYLTVYVSLDNVMGELLSRAFCAVSGIPMDETTDVSEDTYSHKLRIALSCYPSLRDNFILEKWPRGTKKCRDIRRLVDQVEQDEGRKVKAVYTDYGDCLRSEHTFKDPRFGLDEIFSDMASMAEEMKFTHLTATQANRAGKWIDGDIDTVAESWQKMWHTTTGVVLWRNKLEAMQGLARLLVGKARRTRVNYVVPVVMDPNNMRVTLDTNRAIQFRAQVEQMAEEAAKSERKRKKGEPTQVETMPPIGTNFIAPQTRPLLMPTPPQIWLPPMAGVA